MFKVNILQFPYILLKHLDPDWKSRHKCNHYEHKNDFNTKSYSSMHIPTNSIHSTEYKASLKSGISNQWRSYILLESFLWNYT